MTVRQGVQYLTTGILLHCYPLINFVSSCFTIFFLQRACWGREDRHAETVRVMLKNGVPHDLASRDGKTCEQMTRNKGTLAALLEVEEDSYEEL